VFTARYGLNVYMHFRLLLFAGFLGPRANVELVHKMQFALYASHETLPKINCKTVAKRSPLNAIKTLSYCRHANTKFCPNSQLTSCAAYCQQSSFRHLIFVISKSFTLLTPYLYQKDERGLYGNPQNTKIT
jgi:hypothetical protein